MAGLACAVEACRRGFRPVLHEAARHAGGRCRSFRDPTLGRIIDNGNHLLLAGNRAAAAYIDTIGARDRFHTGAPALFRFIDLASGERWALRPNGGRLPWWILIPSRRASGTGLADHLAAARLASAGKLDTVAGVLRTSPAGWRRFWEPLAVAVLNTAPEEAAAAPLWPVIAETFLAGEAACRPMFARDGLSAALVEPALGWLRRQGAEIRFGCRLARMEEAGGRATALVFGEERLALAPGDAVVLALPPAATAVLLPDIAVPEAFRAIVNAHYRLAAPLEDAPPLLGMIGGTAQWLFVRGDLVSVTVSAADGLAAETAEVIAARLWSDVAAALALGAAPLPAWRVVKERRATFAQTPAQNARRPGPRTETENLFLAGDWTDTGLPATIEGAIRSGVAAAALALD